MALTESRVFESSEDSYDDGPELGEGDFSFIKAVIEPYLIRIANLYHQGETQTGKRRILSAKY